MSLRRTLLLALAIASPSLAQVPAPAAAHAAFPTGTPLGAQIAVLLADPAVARAHWGIAVTGLDGIPIYGFDEGKFFRPASNVKLFTTAAAMALLGSTSHAHTALYTESPVATDGLLHGSLAIRSDGSAYLSVEEVTVQPIVEGIRRPSGPETSLDSMVKQLAATGVTEITGDVLADDSYWPWQPYPVAWSIDDLNWGYGAPVTPLSINDNQLDLKVQPGLTAGAPAVISLAPETGYYTLKSEVTTVAARQPADIEVERQLGSRTIRIYGTVAMGAPYMTELAIDDPAVFVAEALRASLLAHGIKVDGVARALHRPPVDLQGFTRESQEALPALRPRETLPTEGFTMPCTEICTLVAERPSPSLGEDIAFTLKASQNLHAEILQRRLGKTFGTDGTTAQGARVVRQWLRNIGLDGSDFLFYDGSGLGDHDLITPRASAQLLAYVVTQPWFAQWKAALPLGGVDGTLQHRFTEPPLRGHVFAKTGTLGESRALAGYLDAASGRPIIFSIMVDNHTTATSAERLVMDKIVAAIAAAN